MYKQKKISSQNDLTIKDALILIVDDAPENIQLLSRLLSKRDYRIAVASDGEKGISTARKVNPDLILLDIIMPDINGYSICRKLKEDPDLWEIPVIFISGRSEQQDIITGFRLGGADYITKPFNADELLARIETHLKIKKYRDFILVQKRELETLVATQDKLYSVIAHDLKASLDGILLLTEYIKDDVGKTSEIESVQKSLTIITQSARSTSQMLDNLLKWCRIQLGEIRPSFRTLDLQECLRSCISIYTSYAAQKDIGINLDSRAVTISGDHNMLSVLFRNLISNAIKYSNRGGDIVIGLSEIENEVLVSVMDDGIGIPDDLKSRLFDPDDRPTRLGTDKEQSTGLGLLLCKDVARMHGGELTVDSEQGRGATFLVRLPKRVE
ncbi:MAG: hybrid sensor histidine kinase/response regulator [Balneolaceae bacterium]